MLKKWIENLLHDFLFFFLNTFECYKWSLKLRHFYLFMYVFIHSNWINLTIEKWFCIQIQPFLLRVAGLPWWGSWCPQSCLVHICSHEHAEHWGSPEPHMRLLPPRESHTRAGERQAERTRAPAVPGPPWYWVASCLLCTRRRKMLKKRGRPHAGSGVYIALQTGKQPSQTSSVIPFCVTCGLVNLRAANGEIDSTKKSLGLCHSYSFKQTERGFDRCEKKSGLSQ